MTSNSRLLALAIAGLAGATGPAALSVQKAMPAETRITQRQTKRQLLRAGSGGVIRWGYLKRPPGTVAQAKRKAIKAKNRAKHRAACRAHS